MWRSFEVQDPDRRHPADDHEKRKRIFSLLSAPVRSLQHHEKTFVILARDFEKNICATNRFYMEIVLRLRAKDFRSRGQPARGDKKRVPTSENKKTN
jgi:hypothetical protein